jgi:hypothetical protein
VSSNPTQARCTRYNIRDKVCQWLKMQQVVGFLQVLVSSTNKPDHQDTTEILLKVGLNTITLPHLNNVCYILECLFFHSILLWFTCTVISWKYVQCNTDDFEMYIFCLTWNNTSFIISYTSYTCIKKIAPFFFLFLCVCFINYSFYKLFYSYSTSCTCGMWSCVGIKLKKGLVTQDHYNLSWAFEIYKLI